MRSITRDSKARWRRRRCQPARHDSDDGDSKWAEFQPQPVAQRNFEHAVIRTVLGWATVGVRDAIEVGYPTGAGVVCPCKIGREVGVGG